MKGQDVVVLSAFAVMALTAFGIATRHGFGDRTNEERIINRRF